VLLLWRWWRFWITWNRQSAHATVMLQSESAGYGWQPRCAAKQVENLKELFTHCKDPELQVEINTHVISAYFNTSRKPQHYFPHVRQLVAPYG